MKFVCRTVMVVFVSWLLSGCASTDNAEAAPELPFEYFFPDSGFNYTFSTIDEAYEFISQARGKFARTVRNFRQPPGVRNNALKLSGPMPVDSSVHVIGWIRATHARSPVPNTAVDIDLSKTKDSQYLMSVGFPYIQNPTLETVLKRVNDQAFLVFIIFYNGRAIALPDFYLSTKYSGYSTNQRIQRFTISGVTYTTMWILNSWEYLRGGET